MCYVIQWNYYDYFDLLVQERRNSFANALESRLSCTNLSIWCNVLSQTHFRCNMYNPLVLSHDVWKEHYTSTLRCRSLCWYFAGYCVVAEELQIQYPLKDIIHLIFQYRSSVTLQKFLVLNYWNVYTPYLFGISTIFLNTLDIRPRYFRPSTR